MEMRSLPPLNDTIAAIATSTGRGAIGIIRVSGPETVALLEKLIRSKPSPTRIEPWRMHRGSLFIDGAPMDQIMFVVYRSPKSYTGEDMAELFLHGGAALLRLALNALIDAGARAALPGEFTMRAVINDKIDILQAEAIELLVESLSERGIAAAHRTLSGEASRRLNAVFDEIEEISVGLTAALEFPDDVPTLPADWMEKLEKTKTDMDELIRISANSEMLTQGAQVVISGAPNVGKSSLFNAIISEERAIVHSEPGTTRDFIDAKFFHNGISMTLYDTAGLRSIAEHPVETIGMERTARLIRESDVILRVFEAPDAPPRALQKEKEIWVANKSDLGVQSDWGGKAIVVSALKKKGIEAVVNAVAEQLGAAADNEITMSERVRSALNVAKQSLIEVEAHIADGMWDVALADVDAAKRTIAEALGRKLPDNVLSDIFAHFCIGK